MKLINYNEIILVNTPTEFEDELLFSIRNNFSEYINEIFINVEAYISRSLLSIYKNKIERHLFPAIVLSTDIGLNRTQTIRICTLFVIGYSLPILLLDQFLDNNSNSSDYNCFLEALNIVYKANFYLTKDGFERIAKRFNQQYLFLTDSMRQEMALKYKIPEPTIVSLYREKILTQQKYYRSGCHYFSAITEGILEQGKWKIDKSLQKYLSCFGLLRQIADEIPDVEEDLELGIITLPMLFTNAKKDIKEIIKSYWKKNINFRDIKIIISETGGYYETYLLGVELYELSRNLKSLLLPKYPFIENLSVFLDLKFAFLNRLQKDNWIDKKPIQ